ncbi:DUF2442 domain-containing protein [Truepera radiovictrix]|uniref:DUF2442 domain-containing protein n=1 Tax=Truepera radiovictrix (strain DSM 17093 / CIP 108686 / LMG 22925 / RQ-24) TaxID=649638 RepID=D7CX43_TRURR|nr:DUF2442 domain-containing protein [Truepera radiovictrix]ADI14551.1 Protein of unknown function DUF2442 [Truepera radiovictrix DSM 17093]WMT56899.1 DUF2442 domain-containing protein [Truepera radiovictrix]
MSVIANLIEVRALPDYKLWLHYDDGVVGEVDLSQLVGKGVFKLWNDYRRFEQVVIGPHGELAWGDDIDLCADALYLELSGKRPEEVFASLRTEHVDA